MNTPLISVIVPVYNLEKYLPACLDSLLAQTYQNLEIILVDDGSTDHSAKLCDAFVKLIASRPGQANSPSAKAIHQKNQGLSAARNAGIKAASGELLVFVDGDDLVSQNFLLNLVSTLQNYDADLAVCGFQTFENTPELSKSQKNTPKTSVISGEKAVVNLLVGQENLDIMSCNKLYRKKLFDGIEFPVGELNEDSLTTYKLYAAAKKVSYTNEKLYFYRQNRTGSIMKEQNLLVRLGQREKAAREAIKYFSDDKHLAPAAEISLLTAKFAYLDNALYKKIPENYGTSALDWIKSHKTNCLKNPYLTKKLKLYLKNLNLYKIFRKIKN